MLSPPSRRAIAFTVAACMLAGCRGAVLPVAGPAGALGNVVSNPNDEQEWRNDIGPRYQWEHSYGYCGEVSFISAGLYYGQYVSQYDARAAATNAPQYAYRSQLLLGGTDMRAARNMHLAMSEWDRKSEKNTPQFLAWVAQNVAKGYPVAIGIYTNEYRFYGDRNRHAGSPEYDHIVPVIGATSDKILFSDNGLWGSGPKQSPYLFHYQFTEFQKTREQANDPNGPLYSTASNGKNYGAAITGVVDTDHETLPVRVTTSANDEIPQIAKHSNQRPQADKLTLTVTVSGLQNASKYVLYRYDSLNAIPDGAFNAHARSAVKHWNITGTKSSTFVITENIMTDDVAAYRAVPASAP
jgi:hypothetical protein